MNDTPKTSEAAGVPSKDWEATAERLFECSAALERENVRLKRALSDEGHAHELWSLAQLFPSEGITDGVDRVHSFLLALANIAVSQMAGKPLAKQSQP